MSELCLVNNLPTVLRMGRGTEMMFSEYRSGGLDWLGIAGELGWKEGRAWGWREQIRVTTYSVAKEPKSAGAGVPLKEFK